MEENKSKIPKNVIFLGLVSLFYDIASEMVYPILPIFLTSILGAPVSVVGLIEGTADATASLMRFFSGYISDKMQKRKIFVNIGYGFSSIAKFMIAAATSWHLVLFARFTDRFGKGLRNSARDSMLLESTNVENRGFIFGIHRALDSAGAVIGSLLAVLFLYLLKDNIRAILWIATVPSIIGLVILLFFVVEKKKVIQEKVKIKINLGWSQFDPRLKIFLLASAIFSLGNSADVFLILRGKQLGLSTILVTMAYVLYNIFASALATPAGKLVDKIGAKRVYLMGLAFFALVYFSFAIIRDSFWIWFLFPIYGFYIASTDGVSRAYVSEFTSEKTSGSYFGLYQTTIAICSFIASFIAGLMWTKISPQAPFYFATFMATASFLLLIIEKFYRISKAQ